MCRRHGICQEQYQDNRAGCWCVQIWCTAGTPDVDGNCTLCHGDERTISHAAAFLFSCRPSLTCRSSLVVFVLLSCNLASHEKSTCMTPTQLVAAGLLATLCALAHRSTGSSAKATLSIRNTYLRLRFAISCGHIARTCAQTWGCVVAVRDWCRR